MPFATVKIVPGVRVEQTPTLLTANIVASQNIRWRGGLPEKIGGWTQFYPNDITGTVRAIWPWADTNGTSHLAVAGDGGVQEITSGSLMDISPQTALHGILTITSSMSSSIITITDTGQTLTTYFTVVFTEHVQVGGVTLYGAYPVASVISASQYTIDSGIIATSSTSTTTTPNYAVVSGSQTVTVTFANHGLSVGNTWPIANAVNVGGVLLSGFYTVQTVASSSVFTINAAIATSTGNVTPAIALNYYGTPASGGVPLFGIVDWSLSNFGGILVISPKNGPIYVWNPIGNFASSQMIAQAPIACTGSFVTMPQQQIVAFGASTLGIQDPMLVSWSDAGNYLVWTASVSNQAGNYRLTRGSAIIGGMQGPQQAMLWTDVGMWLMQYVGYPNVYGFFEVGQGCGLIALHAAATVGSVVYWMGRSGFWMYANGAVQPLPCEVWDVIFPTNITRGNVEQIRAAANTAYNEIVWYYPSAASTGENDSYVRYNVLTGEWDYGALAVSAWVDDNIFGNPFATMPHAGTPTNSQIMQMEKTNNANGVAIPWSYTTGFFALSEGEEKVFVDLVIPDFKWKRFPEPDTISETISFTLYTQDYPDAAAGSGVATYGPYSVTSATGAFEPRARGRYFSAQISGSDLNRWSRLGGIRFRYAIDGRN